MSSETENQVLLQHVYFLAFGDGHISTLDPQRNSQLEITHSVNQRNYLLWKFSLLENLGMSFGKEYFTRKEVRIRSQRHELLTIARKRLYDEDTRKKVLTRRILKNINPLGLAIWFMDDGSTKFTHSTRKKEFEKERGNYRVNNFKLAMCDFDLESVENTIEIFKRNFELNWNISFEEKKYYYLSLTNIDQITKFKNIVYPYFYKDMIYKINHPTKSLCDSPEETERNEEK